MTARVPRSREMSAVVKEGGLVRLCRVPIPRVVYDDDVLVRVSTAGICRTDIYVSEGLIPAANPIVLGHEIAGTVVDRGATVSGFDLGDQVVAHPVLACRGFLTADPDSMSGLFLGVTDHGGFAEYVCVPARALHRVPRQLDSRVAAYVEPVVATLAVLKAVESGQRGVVIGANRFSQLTCDVLRLQDDIDVQVCSAAELDRLPASRFDFAIETGADEPTCRALIRALRPGGTLVLKSRSPAPVLMPVREAVIKEITLRAVNYGNFDEAIEFLVTGQLSVAHLLGPEFSLQDHERAFHAAASESHKVFFRVAGSGQQPCAG